jgi:hypothetical protein
MPGVALSYLFVFGFLAHSYQAITGSLEPYDYQLSFSDIQQTLFTCLLEGILFFLIHAPVMFLLWAFLPKRTLPYLMLPSLLLAGGIVFFFRFLYWGLFHHNNSQLIAACLAALVTSLLVGFLLSATPRTIISSRVSTLAACLVIGFIGWLAVIFPNFAQPVQYDGHYNFRCNWITGRCEQNISEAQGWHPVQ